MLFPISLVPFSAIEAWCFDADAKKDSAREIREYFVPDFANWKDHDSYTLAFERLVRDLKGVPGEKATAEVPSHICQHADPTDKLWADQFRSQLSSSEPRNLT